MSNVPKLRFKEFKDEWEEKKLKEIAIIISGSTPPRSNYVYFKEGTIPWVKTMDLNNSIVNTTSEKITNKAVLDRNLKILPENTLLIAMYGGFNQIGRTGILNFEGTINQAISALIPKDSMFNAAYLQQYLNLNVMKWRRFAASSRKDPNITKKDVENFQVCLPSIEEQNKLSDFFVIINKKIQKQQEKIELLKEQKKGYMQKIFNRELRFKDENSNEFPKWNKTRLDKILTERKSYHIKSNEIPHATLSTEGIYLKTERYDRDFLVRNQEKKYKISNLNDICYNPANLKFGVITRNQIGTVIFSPIYITFEIVDGYYPVFIEYMVIRKDFINKVRKYEEGTVYERMAVKPKDFLSLEVLIPCYEEQEKIGDFLKSFDNLIEKEVEYLELIKSQKKSFMQNMFV